MGRVWAALQIHGLELKDGRVREAPAYVATTRPRVASGHAFHRLCGPEPSDEEILAAFRSTSAVALQRLAEDRARRGVGDECRVHTSLTVLHGAMATPSDEERAAGQDLWARLGKVTDEERAAGEQLWEQIEDAQLGRDA